MIITVTGRIGSGKTTACNEFKRLGATLIDADKIGHDILSVKSVSDSLVRAFGKGVAVLGKISRHKLGRIVFNDQIKLQELNRIMHPLIRKKILARTKDKAGVHVIDAALCNELELEVVSDVVVLVTAPKAKIFQRLKSRYDKRIIDNIYKSQALPGRYDYLIENDGGNLAEAVRMIWDDIHA